MLPGRYIACSEQINSKVFIPFNVYIYCRRDRIEPSGTTLGLEQLLENISTKIYKTTADSYWADVDLHTQMDEIKMAPFFKSCEKVNLKEIKKSQEKKRTCLRPTIFASFVLFMYFSKKSLLTAEHKTRI